MATPNDKDLERAYKLLRVDGKKMSEVIALTELKYGDIWLYCEDKELPAKERIKPADQTPAKVRMLRNSGLSWGKIRVLFGYREYTEGKIRKMFEESSGLKSQGLRIGKGGRFFNRQPELYADEHRVPGTEIPRALTRAELAEFVGSPSPNGSKPERVKAAAKRSGAVKAAKKKAPAKKATPAKKAAARMAAAEATEEDPFS